ncbi:MAG: class I SAM-dependent methyltransferase, partial [Pseudomonadota bacterium]
MNSERLSAEQWARFWRNGDVTTFRGRFQRNYDGPVLEFWRQVFAGTRAGERIVDIATGNGALALLCAQYAEANGRDVTITAFDFADIDPARDVGDPALLAAVDRIDFHGGTRIEATGFDDNAFDLAISQ